MDVIILFPAYNGIVGLPITAALLFRAVNDNEAMGEYTNGRALNVLLVVLSVILAITSIPDFLNSISGGI